MGRLLILLSLGAVIGFKLMSMPDSDEVVKATEDIKVDQITSTETTQQIEERYIVPLNNEHKIVESREEAEQLAKSNNTIIYKDTMVQAVGQVQNWGTKTINSDKALKLGYTGKGVKIAVLDTGVDVNHGDLKITGGQSFIDGQSSYQDDNGHGTHVVGIIAAQDNNTGTVGVAPGAQVYALKVLNSGGSGYLSDVIEAIDWSIANNIDIINMSLGTMEDNPLFKEAVDRAYSNGIVVVAAAGNDGNGKEVNYPARYSSVVAVGSIDINKKLSGFSNTGNEVEVVAPGSGILSTIPGGYAEFSGTSMATPFVVGNLALYKETTGLSGQSLRDKLIATTEDLGSKGKDTSFGYGLIQAPNKEEIKPQPPVVNDPVKEEPITTPNPTNEQNAESAVAEAEEYGEDLSKIYNVNVYGELPTPDNYVIDNAKYAYNKAKGSVDSLPNSSIKNQLYQRLQNNVKVHLDRIELYLMAYEDAGEVYHHVSMVENVFNQARLDEEAKGLLNGLKNVINNTSSFDNVYGDRNRRAFIDLYRNPAKQLVDEYSKPFVVNDKLDEIQLDIRYNNILSAERKLKEIKTQIDFVQPQTFYWGLNDRYNNLINQYNAKTL